MGLAHPVKAYTGFTPHVETRARANTRHFSLRTAAIPQDEFPQKGFSVFVAAAGMFTRNLRPCPRPSTKNVMRSSPNIRWW